MTEWLVSCALSCLLFTGQGAPPRPDFSGTWMPVANATARLVVTQTAAIMTMRADGEPTLESRLDGSITKQKEENTEVTAAWRNGALVLTLTITSEFGDTNLQTQVWTIDGTGQLVIETTQDRRGQSRTVRAVYRRVTVTSR